MRQCSPNIEYRRPGSRTSRILYLYHENPPSGKNHAWQVRVSPVMGASTADKNARERVDSRGPYAYKIPCSIESFYRVSKGTEASKNFTGSVRLMNQKNLSDFTMDHVKGPLHSRFDCVVILGIGQFECNERQHYTTNQLGSFGRFW